MQSMAPSSTVPPLPPVSSKAKDYSTDRPVEVTDELDDLRTRGIAKVLNRHFTATTKQLAKEKAEADAALADLERRRAQTSEFKPSKGGEGLNPFDSLYVQLQQRRAECRRKERETMLLYQRYVMKYGKSAKTVTPVKRVPTSTSTNQNKGSGTTVMTALKEEEEDTNYGGMTNKIDPPGVAAVDSHDVGSPSDCTEDERKEHTEQFLSALTKFMSAESRRDNSPEARNAGEGKDEVMASHVQPVSDLTQQTHDGDSLPKAATPTPKVKQFMSAVSNFMSAPATQDIEEEETEEEEGNVASNDVTNQVAGGDSGDVETEETEGGDTGNYGNIMESPSDIQVEPSDEQAMIVDKDEKVHEVAPGTISTSDPATEDGNITDAPVMEPSVRETAAKGTVQQDGPSEADIPAVLVEGEESVEAMQHTTAALASDRPQKSPDPPENIAEQPAEDRETLPPTPVRHESTDGAAVTPLSSSEGVTNETPSFTTTTVDEGDDGDDRSIISGLTFNSAVTRQVMDDIETEMEDFIKTETAAIRRMLDSEEEQSTTISMDYDGDGPNDSLSSQIGDESVRVALKAEAMALEMQRILDEFAKEDIAPNGVDESAEMLNENGTVASRTSSVTTNKYPYPFEPAIAGAEWYVYFDDNYKREFYLEKRSNKTQWDPPNSIPSHKDDQSVVTSDDFLCDIQSVASSRASLSRRSSRRSLYRKQRRKRRMRRLVVSFFALVCVLASVFHWRVNHPEKTFSAALTTTLATILASLENSIDLGRTKTYVIDQLEYKFTDRRDREEAEMRRKADAKAQQLAALKAKEEETKARLEEERRAKEKAIKEEKLRQEQARQEEARRAAYELEVNDKNKKELQSRRPWGCNIPFSYIHPKCNRILKVKPVYDDDFMVFLQ